MSTEPKIIERADQPYVGIRGTVTMQTIGAVADRIPELFGWLGAHGIPPSGAPFLRYDVIDMERQLVIEAGVPVATPATGDQQVSAGVLPAGRYATLTHVGHPDELVDVTARLLAWVREHGLEWDVSASDEGERWGCRLEVYHTDPAEEPDLRKWETDLVFRLADGG